MESNGMTDPTKRTIEAMALELDRVNAENAVLQSFFDNINEMTLRAEASGMVSSLGYQVKAYVDFMRKALEGAKK